MEKEILNFILKNELNPFNPEKTPIKPRESIFRTRDARIIHNKVLSKISKNFIFPETSNLWNFLNFTSNPEEIKIRQEFFKNIREKESFLEHLKKPKPQWKPKYDILVVTENENIFLQLNKICNVQLLLSEFDLQGIENADIIQVIECGQFSEILSRLPQAVFLKSIDEACLERYLEQLSGWSENIEILKNQEGEIKKCADELIPLLELIKDNGKILSEAETEKQIERINEQVMAKVREMTISGDSFLKIVNGQMPEELQNIISNAIKDSGLPQFIFNITVPVSIDKKELDNLIKKQASNVFSGFAERIKSKAIEIKKIPEKLKQLEALIILMDFKSGTKKFISENMKYPVYSEELSFIDSLNIFIENPQPVSFYLSGNSKCSILTGANSGGKTTLLEHILQLVCLFHLGMPVFGEIKMPIFSDVYYFAKNKGSANKGAFETLLTQMSEIKPGKQTLVLADEIESVTEPGVAGKIIAATADYFIKKNCFLVIATHLGHEIQKVLPEKARIDGIEAKGLNEKFELIVNHNPVLGRLAHSTPELIVEKMANSFKHDYFKYLHWFLNN